MPKSIDELVDLLELEEIEVGLFRARQPDTRMQRAFGGQVLAQALCAAVRTVGEDRSLHSMHGYFLIPGRTDIPIVYDVEQIRDGRSFSSRRVVARQGGKTIFYLSASYQIAEDGFEHQDPLPEGVPGPDDCPRYVDLLAAATRREPAVWQREYGALDVRFAGDSRPGGTLTDPRHPARARVWVRVDGRLPDERWIHQAALAYASDLTLLAAATVPHGVFIGDPRLQAASLDHAMWFLREFRADTWLLYDQVSPSASNARGLSTGRLFQEGTLVADVAQEGLIRPTTR